MNNRERLEIALKRGSWLRFPLYILQNYLTVNGRIFIICMMLSAPLSFVALNTTVYMFLTMTTSLLFVGFLLNLFYRPRVELSRTMPHIVESGKKVKYQVEITSKRKITNYDIKAKELFWSVYIDYQDAQIIEEIKPGESKVYEMSFIPERRGVYNSEGVVVSTSFPFNLFNRGRKIASPAKMFVFPEYKRLESFDLNMGRKYQPGGIALSSNIGESTEFIGTREFAYGDNPRHIHWKSWAKTGKPVIKEFQEEYFIRLALLIDTQTEEREFFEKGLSMAASIADYLSRQDYIIDIFAAGNSFYHFQSGRALAHFENILELLACIEPEVDLSNIFKRIKVFFEPRMKNNLSGNHSSRKTFSTEETYQSLLGHLNNLSAVIFVFMDWNEKNEKLLKNILEHGIGVKAFVFAKSLKKEIPQELKAYVEYNL